MKKIIILSALLAATLTSCDKVSDPLKNDLGFIELPDSTNKVVLLEEFTGVKCTNCPKAAEKAHEFLQSFPGRVVVLSIHESNFAVPDAVHPPDYRVPAGTELYDFFKPVGLPAGMFDRSGYPDGDHNKLLNDWESAMVNALKKGSAPVEISAELKEEASSGELSLKVNLAVLTDLPDRDLYLSCFVVEDSIVSPQSLPDGSIKTDYVHSHMLRASFAGGGFGEQIAGAGAADGDLFSEKYTLPLQAEWNPKHLSAVVFVYDRNTYEVLQAHHAEYEK